MLYTIKIALVKNNYYKKYIKAINSAKILIFLYFEVKLWGPFKNSQKFDKTFVRIFRMGITKKYKNISIWERVVYFIIFIVIIFYYAIQKVLFNLK